MLASNRGGVALLEVLIALLIGAVVLLGARALVEGIADNAQHISRHARNSDRTANAIRIARATVGRLRLVDPDPAFSGDRRTSSFASWCYIPRGWLEPCAARLAVEDSGASERVTLSLSTGERVSVWRGTAELRYLASAEAGGQWYPLWGSALVPPLAIGIVTDRDTILLPIGERR